MSTPHPSARLANPRGFCAGVDRAIEIVKRALELHGSPVYVLHEIVHNKYVLEDLRARGTVFVKSLDEVPVGSVTIFSAHGVSDAVVESAKTRKLQVVDATCPLVTKVHQQAVRYAAEDRDVILIGHAGHPEVEGTSGRIQGRVHVLSTPEEVNALEVANPEHLAYVTQTTLSVDDTTEVIKALRKRFPHAEGPDLKDICYATQNRQNAVKEMLPLVDLLIVVGSANSSNSSRLRELGERHGVPSYLVDHPNQIGVDWFASSPRVGVTAGASAPEGLVRQILGRIEELGVKDFIEMDGEDETVVFQMPPELETLGRKQPHDQN
ncbi:MAG: 4-hydroxy-3-methylbut-2-enyl diphosphate reductase [Planctomycetota bacterium]|jgi:4-hydroxy-3-methylbut-2-enyl diphosphate reductase